MRILLTGATVLRGGGEWSGARGLDVLIDEGVIAAIGPSLSQPGDAHIVPASSLVLMPAFVNAHTHSPEALGRGVTPMAGQVEWLDNAYADGRDALSDADIVRAVRLCAADIVRGGAVRVTDHFRQVPARAHATAVAAMAWDASGVQARIAPVLRDRTAPGGGLVGVPDSARLAASTRDVLAVAQDVLAANLPILAGVGPSAPHRVTNELLLGLSALARARGSFLHMHLCESAEDAASCRALYGMSAVAQLHRLGVLGPHVELVHVVHVDDADLALIAASGARIVHNPTANLRLGSGVARVARALAHGVEVVLATDGAGSNDTQSMLEAVKFALLAPRAAMPRSEWLSPEQVLHMATDGARLEPGAAADLIAFDAGASAFVGVTDGWAARIGLAARETDIVHVLGRGRFLMRDRALCLP